MGLAICQERGLMEPLMLVDLVEVLHMVAIQEKRELRGGPGGVGSGSGLQGTRNMECR